MLPEAFNKMSQEEGKGVLPEDTTVSPSYTSDNNATHHVAKDRIPFFRSTLFQILIVGSCAFCAPGVSNTNRFYHPETPSLTLDADMERHEWSRSGRIAKSRSRQRSQCSSIRLHDCHLFPGPVVDQHHWLQMDTGLRQYRLPSLCCWVIR